MSWHTHKWQDEYHKHYNDRGLEIMTIFQECQGCSATQWTAKPPPPPPPPIRSQPDRIQKGGRP